MMEMIFATIGGIGLFLLAMFLITDGLKEIAGTRLRRMLRHSTRNPATGVLSGALATALLQSSSATTVATVGFVGAGLISFPDALGIIFGANIGTTATGWIVALVGFKLQIGLLVTPLFLVGILMRIFAVGRWRRVGLVVAGFGLLFIAINTMQQGMQLLADYASPADFPGDTLIGRSELVAIGIVITVVTQSSSAGVAIALSALSAGAINFGQAAAMVIGMNIGTTSSALLATVGGSTAMRRTGMAHVIYNVMTGLLAFASLTPLTWLAERLSQAGLFDAEIGLVAFHSLFNIIGVLLFIGFTNSFAGLVMRMVPERGPRLTERLDDRLLVDTGAAVDALAATTGDIARTLFSVISEKLRGTPSRNNRTRVAMADEALEAARLYAGRIKSHPGREIPHARYTAAIHVLDHLARLQFRIRQEGRLATIRSDESLARRGLELAGVLKNLQEEEYTQISVDHINGLRKRLRHDRQSFRESAIEQAPGGAMPIEDIIQLMDAMRWLHRVSYHAWRIVYHQMTARTHEPSQPASQGVVADVVED
jgi:phosphate:Na+ symporter